MDLLTVLQVLRRRWVVFGGALFLTLATALLLARVDTATYASQGAVVIVRGPGAAGVEGVDGADPVLQQTARLLAEVAPTSGAVSGLEAAEVNVAVDPNLPILRITGVAEEGPAATQAAEAAVQGITTQLEGFQQSGEFAVPEGTEIRTLVAPTAPDAEQAEDGSLRFTSTATMLLSRATQPTEAQAPVSGIIVPSQSERFVASVVYERMFDDGVRREMAEQGATGDFEITFDEASPILRVEAASGDADEALQTGQVVIETMQQVASDIQESDGIPDDLRFRVEALAYPLFPFISDSATLRTVLAVLALGLLASVGVALMVDAAAARREAHWRVLGPTAASTTPEKAGPWEMWVDDEPEASAGGVDDPSGMPRER